MDKLHIFIVLLALFFMTESRCITKNTSKGKRLRSGGNGFEPPRLRNAYNRLHKLIDREIEKDDKSRERKEIREREISSKIDQQFGDILCSSCCTMKGDEKEKCILKYCADVTDPCEAVISFETPEVRKPLNIKDSSILSGNME